MSLMFCPTLTSHSLVPPRSLYHLTSCARAGPSIGGPELDHPCRQRYTPSWDRVAGLPSCGAAVCTKSLQDLLTPLCAALHCTRHLATGPHAVFEPTATPPEGMQHEALQAPRGKPAAVHSSAAIQATPRTAVSSEKGKRRKKQKLVPQAAIVSAMPSTAAAAAVLTIATAVAGGNLRTTAAQDVASDAPASGIFTPPCQAKGNCNR